MAHKSLQDRTPFSSSILHHSLPHPLSFRFSGLSALPVCKATWPSNTIHTCFSLCRQSSSSAWLTLTYPSSLSWHHIYQKIFPLIPRKSLGSPAVSSYTEHTGHLLSWTHQVKLLLNIHPLMQAPWEEGSYMFYSLFFSPASCTIQRRYSTLFIEYVSIIVKELINMYV